MNQPQVHPQGLDDGSNQAPYTDPEPVQPAQQTRFPQDQTLERSKPNSHSPKALFAFMHSH